MRPDVWKMLMAGGTLAALVVAGLGFASAQDNETADETDEDGSVPADAGAGKPGKKDCRRHAGKDAASGTGEVAAAA